MWECCCLGLPTLLVVLADNQLSSSSSLCEQGAMIGIQRGEKFAKSLRVALEEFGMPGKLQIMSKLASKVTSGRGVDYVVEHFR